LTELELRDEAVTLFLAGAETTAVALAWILHLLARDPEVAARARAEVAEVAGSAIRAEHVPALTYTTKIVKEALRLFPPAWMIGREAIRDCTVGDFAIPAGTQLLTIVYFMHRDPVHFPDPERFWPERWTEELTARLPRSSYFPFGGGQRLCIGYQLAMTELVIAVATVVAGADLSPAEHAPVPQPGFTLRPREGVRLTLQRRRAHSSQPAIQSNEELRL
jgi:cytochrome P450